MQRLAVVDRFVLKQNLSARIQCGPAILFIRNL